MAFPSIWRNRAYMILWSGQIVSVLGSGISQITIPLIVLYLTHSPAQAGFVGALAGLPYPLFGLVAGALVDRWDRKRAMMVCEGVNVVLTGAISIALLLNRLTVPELYVAAFVWGTVFVFFNVAEIAALSSVVSTEQLPQATAQNQATFAVAGLLGPPIGGFLYQIARGLPFVADTVSYAASLCSLWLISSPFQGAREPLTDNFWTQIRDGLRWLWSHETIRAVTLLTAGSNLLSGGFGLLIILLARQHHASPGVIGLIFALGSVGAATGSLAAPWVQRHLGVASVVLIFFWAGAAVLPLYLLAPNLPAISAVSALLFMLGPLYNVVIISYRIAMIPEGMQGRINGAVRVLALGAVPIGSALTGVLLQQLGVTGTIWVITAGTLLLAVTATASKGVRHPSPVGGQQRA